MIRLIRRRLIIPRGDTGSFSIPTLGTVNEGDIAIFGIFDPLTHETLVMKKVDATENTLTISLATEDTINLEPRKYNWDITIYKSPEYDEDGELIGAAETNSYYSAFKLPVCEITEVALDMNKERWRTRDLTLDVNKMQSNCCNCMQAVYPWEQMQRSQLQQQLFKIAQDNGYMGPEKDFIDRYAQIYSNGTIVNGTINTFPVPGNMLDLYFDTETEILYYFKETENSINSDLATLLGAHIVGTSEDGLTYIYIPVRAMTVENTILNGGGV